MKIFSTTQIRQIDQLTIKYESISSINLMERAADRILRQFRNDYGTERDVLVLSGPGNNGGDGLALARMLLQTGYEVQAVLLLHSGGLSEDCNTNKERLIEYFPDSLSIQSTHFQPAKITTQTIIIDALFGSGLTRSVTGIFKDAVNWLNDQPNTIISIDIPSGLDGENIGNTEDTIVKANLTYTLQFPKLAFFLSENERYTGKWQVVDIQLHPRAISEIESNLNYTEKSDIRKFLKKRSRFSHKGTYGHALIWAGQKGMAGAAVLAAKSALRSGAGLVSVHSVEENRVILQTVVPEAIFKNELHHTSTYNSFAFGPGLGTEKQTTDMFFELLKTIQTPIVLDADALNILSQNKHFLNFIPPKSILTPHPKEFERLFGTSENSADRLKIAVEKSKEYGIYIVLKGANTLITTPEGNLYFNSTGNPGMATGGMGDVLTGIIVGLLAQGYSTEESAIFGVYLHGLAGDLCIGEQSEESLLPTDIISALGKAFLSI